MQPPNRSPSVVQGAGGFGAVPSAARGFCSRKPHLAPCAALASLDFGLPSDVHPHHCLLLENAQSEDFAPRSIQARHNSVINPVTINTSVSLGQMRRGNAFSNDLIVVPGSLSA